MIKQQTLVPEFLNIELTSSLKFYKQATNYLDAVGGFVNELGIAIEYEKTVHESDPITERKDFFKALNNLSLTFKGINEEDITTGFKNLTTTFVVFWLERFNTATKNLQDLVTNELGSGNVYFKPISENIGMIGKHPNYTLDNNTIPYYPGALSDTLTPWMYPGTVNNKLRPNSKCVSKVLSYRTNSLLRNHMHEVQEVERQGEDFTSTSHGDNLITDLKYWSTVTEISVEILSIIATQFGDLCRVIQFYSAYNPQDTNLNKKVAPAFGYIASVEGAQEALDVFQNKLKGLPSTRSVNVLSVVRDV